MRIVSDWHTVVATVTFEGRLVGGVVVVVGLNQARHCIRLGREIEREREVTTATT